jgi:hypothetical protein
MAQVFEMTLPNQMVLCLERHSPYFWLYPSPQKEGRQPAALSDFWLRRLMDFLEVHTVS